MLGTAGVGMPPDCPDRTSLLCEDAAKAVEAVEAVGAVKAVEAAKAVEAVEVLLVHANTVNIN